MRFSFHRSESGRAWGNTMRTNEGKKVSRVRSAPRGKWPFKSHSVEALRPERNGVRPGGKSLTKNYAIDERRNWQLSAITEEVSGSFRENEMSTRERQQRQLNFIPAVNFPLPRHFRSRNNATGVYGPKFTIKAREGFCGCVRHIALLPCTLSKFPSPRRNGEVNVKIESMRL